MLRELLTGIGPPAYPDGVTPLFQEVGAAPTAANAILPPGSIVRFGTAYYVQVGTLAAPVWVLSSSLGAGPSAEDFWTAQAAQKLGVAPKNLFGRFLDFDDGGRMRVVSGGTGSTTGTPALDGSWHTYTAGDDTLAGNVGFTAAALFSNQVPRHVANLRTSPWFLVGRWKTTTTPGATARSTIGFLSGGLRAGIVKASHATKFCAAWTGAVLASTVSFDTATHEVVCRNDGTNVYLSVDGEAEVSAAVGALSVSSDELMAEIVAGALEAKQTFTIDYVGLWTGRT